MKILRKERSPALAFIFITLLIDVTGFGLVIPVLPDLILHLSGGSHEHGARVYGSLLSVFGLMQFLCAPILGNLSDRFGRRPVLLVSLAFAAGDYVLQAVAPTIAWFFLGRVIVGITGASFSAATAYIADITPPEKRAQNFGMIGTAFGLGFIIGPAIGGLLGGIGPRVPFWAAAGVTLLNFLYGYFVLPESLGPENRRPFTVANANPFKSLAIIGRHRWVLMLCGMASLLWLAQQVPPSIWVLYTEYKFHWGRSENGSSLAALGAATMFVQMVVIRQMTQRMSLPRMLAFSLVFNFIGFILMGTAPNGGVMLASMLLWTLCFVGGPAIQSMVSEQFGADEQGAIQGAMSGVMALCGVVGPLAFSWIFGYFTGPSPIKLPGAPFLIGAVLTVFAAVIAYKAVTIRSQAGISS